MTDDEKPVRLIPKAQPDNLLKALQSVVRNQAAIIEYNAIDAKIKRAKYLALIEEGFTKEEALELCR